MPKSKKRPARGQKRATQPAPQTGGFDRTEAYSAEIAPILSALRSACSKHGLPHVVGVCYFRGPEGDAGGGPGIRMHAEASAPGDGWQPRALRCAADALRPGPDIFTEMVLRRCAGLDPEPPSDQFPGDYARSRAARFGGSGRLLDRTTRFGGLLDGSGRLCGDCLREVSIFVKEAVSRASVGRQAGKGPWQASVHIDLKGAEEMLEVGAPYHVVSGHGATRYEALRALAISVRKWATARLLSGQSLTSEKKGR